LKRRPNAAASFVWHGEKTLRNAGLAGLILMAALTVSTVSAQVSDDAAETEIATAPVEVDGAELFRVRGVSSYPAPERARRIRERIEAVAADPTIPLDSLRIVEREGLVQIVARDRPIVAFVPADAHLEQVGPMALATAHLARIRQAIAEYREARSPAALKRGAVNALMATFVFAVAIVAFLWVWRRAGLVMTRRLQPHIHSIGFQSFTLLRADSIARVVRNSFRALRAVVLLTVILIYTSFEFAQFPWTRRLSGNVGAFLLDPLRVIGRGIIEAIPSLIFLTVLFFVARLALRLARLFFDAVARGSVTLNRFDREWADPTYKIVRVAVILLALIVAYPYIPGSQSDAFKGVSLFLGVVLSIGSSGAISNIIAGYMMTYRRAFRVGDRVKIGEAVGDVTEMRLQVTHLRSFKNEEIVLPNSQILTSEVLNYSSIARTEGLILHTEVGIGYDTPWRQVEAMLFVAAERTPGLLSDPGPFVRLKKLGDFSVTYELNVYCCNAQAMGQLYTELHRRILDVFNEYGVQIMTPAYEGDPREPKVVARQDWYAAPARQAERRAESRRA
jgi:small-conductance mechanosensitive channel